MPPEELAVSEPSAAEMAPTAPPDVPEVAPEPTPADAYEGKLANMTAQHNGLQTELKKHMAIGKTAAAELAELRAQVASDKEELETDTLGFLKSRGRGYDVITAGLLKSDEPALTPEQEQIKELLADKEARDERDAETEKTATQTAADQRHEGNLTLVRASLSEEGSEDPQGTYAYSTILDQAGVVLAKFQKFHDDNHHEPSSEQQNEMALEVETGLRERTHAHLKALLKADKSGALRTFLTEELSTSNETAPIDGQATTRRKKGPGNGVRTLTQRSTSNPGPPTDPATRPRLSEAERVERAHERLKGLGYGNT